MIWGSNDSNEISKDQAGGASLALEQAQYEEVVFPGKEKSPQTYFTE